MHIFNIVPWSGDGKTGEISEGIFIFTLSSKNEPNHCPSILSFMLKWFCFFFGRGKNENTYFSHQFEIDNLWNTLIFYQIEPKKMDPLQFCLPVFLAIHRNPRQKEFFNLRERFLILSYLSTFISTWTEPETNFGKNHRMALSWHFK